MKDSVINKVKSIIDESRVMINEPMCNHTTFRIGGEADLFVQVANVEEIIALIKLLKEENEQYFILGNGSNLLVADEGYRGCIISVGKAFSGIEVLDENTTESKMTIKVLAGTLLIKTSIFAYDNSLTGMEFASGIPGNIGGAIYMNAGAYGGEMKNIVKSVSLYDIENDSVVEKSCNEMDFSYRHSIVKEHPYVVLSAVIELEKGDKNLIHERMNELALARKTKQPLEYPSAGSTFKRPEGYFAGKLIEDAGLKGYSVGGAEVSIKHSGFVINKDSATAKDVLTLIDDVRKIVKEKFNVTLEPEVLVLK